MAGPRFKLAIIDIDGTLRRVPDPWLHLHKHLRCEAAGEGYYQSWRRGEITYLDLCRLDAAQWRGVRREAMLEALATNPLRDGALELIGWFKGRGVACVGLSTGLSLFHEVTAAALGLSQVVCNELCFEAGRCTGEVIVHLAEDEKSTRMDQLLREFGCDASQTVVLGDGTADIPILARAGLAIAVFPRSPEVAASAHCVVSAEPISRVIPWLEQAFDRRVLTKGD
jgi:phosphoserine phosphatase